MQINGIIQKNCLREYLQEKWLISQKLEFCGAKL